jgi:hypothetical protein
MAYGPASATVGGVPVSGNGQTNQAGGLKVNPLPNPLPLTLGVQQQIGRSLEVRGDVGWVDSGVGLRVLLPLGEEPPFLVSVGARSGEVGAFRRPSYHGVLALESYPAVSRRADGNAHRLMLSLGVAAGAFEHDLSLPSSFESSSDAPHGLPSEIVIRPELRLQAAVGIHLQGPRDAIAFALQPWVVLASAAPTHATCDQCAAPQSLTTFSHGWGLALLVTPALRL